MACTDVSPIVMPLNPTYSTVGATPKSGSSRLYVCDNPETLSNLTFEDPIIQLWSELVPNTTSVKYRLFMWHYNDSTTATRKYGVTVGNAGTNSVTVSNIKYDTEVGTIGNFLATVGPCLAKAMLAQTYSTAANKTVATNSVQTVLEFELGPGVVRGTIIEFTLSSASPMIARIRTVASSSTSAVLNTWQGNNVAPKGTHPRGSWSYSEVETADKTISFGAVPAMTGYSVMGDPSIYPGDEKNEADEVDDILENPGGYGGIFNINLILKNNSTKSQLANLYLNPRGGSFNGAVKVGSNPVIGVASIPAQTHGAKIGAFSLAPGESKPVPIKITTGGGSSTPIVLALHNLG